MVPRLGYNVFVDYGLTWPIDLGFIKTNISHENIQYEQYQYSERVDSSDVDW